VHELTGEGDIFLRGGGKVKQKELNDGEKLCIPEEKLVAFSEGIDFRK